MPLLRTHKVSQLVPQPVVLGAPTKLAASKRLHRSLTFKNAHESALKPAPVDETMG
jgi:hypothetical protein